MPIASVNPATGETMREFEPLGADAIAEKLKLSAQAFLDYRKVPFEERAAKMRRAAGILRKKKRDFAELMTREMGKTIASAEAEVEKCAWVCEFYAEKAQAFLAEEEVATDAGRSFVRYEPLGPVLAVMPWNFPFWQVFRFAAPALMAGNVGLLKHASNVPQCALAIEEIFRDAGFPAGVFQTLLVEAGRVEGILRDPRVVAATLTGSEPAGRRVAAVAGEEIKKTVLELGGSDPFVVLPSADLERALDSAVKARIINNGQSCIAAKRFIVHEAVASAFEKRLTERFDALRVGDPLDERNDMGPLARPEFVEELHSQVERTVAAGARLLTGGRRIEGPGYFYEPTVLGDVRPGMAAHDEETFGPVAAVIRVRNLEEAIEVANATGFGLGASVWTNDESERARLIAEIEAGAVFVNGMVKSDPRLPFGGIKRSGYGRELGSFGIREFVNVKTVWVA